MKRAIKYGVLCPLFADTHFKLSRCSYALCRCRCKCNVKISAHDVILRIAKTTQGWSDVLDGGPMRLFV